jgi:selenocysteine lyase/cysteine desulfurase
MGAAVTARGHAGDPPPRAHAAPRTDAAPPNNATPRTGAGPASGAERRSGGAKPAFARVLAAVPGRLHVAAHSHHPWPDVTAAAQHQAWRDAATMLDDKWEHIFGAVLPEARSWIAAVLGLPDPASVAVAPNTHELVVRVLSCLDTPARVLTTDGEFASFGRQIARLAEDGLVSVRRVPVHPAATLTDRLAEAAADGGFDLLFFSHVMFATGVVVTDLDAVVAAVRDDDALVVIDGYHGFMALPTDLSAVADRAFYMAGGYKYAMAGEGVGFAHCPAGYGRRPRDTGWFADLAGVTHGAGTDVRYPPDGRRFMGATFDPSGLYRFNAVQRWLADDGWTVGAIHAHVEALQRRLIARIAARADLLVAADALVAGPPARTPHGHLLAFAHPHADRVDDTLARRDVVVDHRDGHVRIGFGLYHDHDDVDDLVDRLRR